LREVEHLAVLFDEIIWYGFPNGKVDSLLYRTPNNSTIKLNIFPNAIGGHSFWKKLSIIPHLPLLVITIGVLFNKYHYIHTRGPSVPAWIAILFARIFKRKNVWHKYAGNWIHPHPPLSYRIQRNLLRKSLHSVTVNGLWNEPNLRILNFENPCFSESELIQASEFSRIANPSMHKILFVGRLEPEKGIRIVLEAARNLPDNLQWIIVGEGKDEIALKEKVADLERIKFLGALNRLELNTIYQQCHFLLLPSLSEGFPKVISEACGFGCIPIVSNVSAISQYIKPDVGYLLPELSAKAVCDAIQDLTNGQVNLQQMSLNAVNLARSFTYERFVKRIKEEVFKIQ
jgi:glycosyltransferase involved in cell wall biosynthesis